MAKFIGEYSVKIDDKGRMIFPSAFKSVFPADEKLSFVVKKDLYENCLEMYTYKEWEEESNAVKARLNFFNKEHAEFWREYMRDRAFVEPDEKLGRITIPRKILDSIGAEKEMIFAGNDHKIEIWAKESYEQKRMDPVSFAQLAQKIMG
ncbi:MAG: protein mraZ [Bacteroidales bacterium]|jgi:MraZ protein|nr:protein mraZ [Bacteroidales bacterium]MBQ1218594.1 protein mraZ [Bacteroidales bacterium]MBQ1929620.1 protein mraZ [Bacteroidales bacterium]MBQ5594015.1 protein mraZ [Bacteroidales bacterium]MBQ5783997.1 protein mraZ [Bacteroidales bacterium]